MGGRHFLPIWFLSLSLSLFEFFAEKKQPRITKNPVTRWWWNQKVRERARARKGRNNNNNNNNYNSDAVVCGASKLEKWYEGGWSDWQEGKQKV
jgi:hypothetical protein